MLTDGGCVAEESAREGLIDHRDLGRFRIVLPGKVAASHQACLGGLEVAGRDGEELCPERSVGGAELRGSIPVDGGGAATSAERRGVDGAGSSDARGGQSLLHHALLQRQSGVVGVARHLHIGGGQHRALRLKADRRVQRALHAAQRDQRGGHQQRAQRDLQRRAEDRAG